MKSTSKMTKGMSTILLGLIVVVFASETFAQGAWAPKAPMPTVRSYLSVAEGNGIVYAIGGDNGTSANLATVEAYNPTDNTWVTKAAMPTARYALAATTVNGIVYAIGGMTGTSPIWATVEAYNPATNTWSTVAPMPTARHRMAAVAVNGIVYAIGGQHGFGGPADATVEAYNPATNTWSTVAPMPTARLGLAAVAVNGIVYAIGGYSVDSTAYLATIEAYDPATNTWSTKAPMPTARSALAAVAVNGIVYAIGGHNVSSGNWGKATVETYDPATNTWSTEAAMPTARAALGAAVVNGVVYAIGGGNNVINFATVEAFTPAPTNLQPTAVPGSDQSIHAGQVVSLNGSGSFDDNTPSENLQYAWTITLKPEGSTTLLANADTATPSFVADKVGTYTIQLVVTDHAGLSSPPAVVNISSGNLLPTANAGTNNSTLVGTAVSFDGSGSSDPNNDPLSYSWTMVAAPAGSVATLSAATSQTPSFTPDIPGQYTIGLIVNDGFGDSAQSLVSLTAISVANYAQSQSSAAINIIATLTTAQLQAAGHKNSLSNLISQAITALQVGDIAEAKSKLSAAISRTDGYPLRGALDTKGPGMDWVTDPVAQSSIYKALKNALDALP